MLAPISHSQISVHGNHTQQQGSANSIANASENNTNTPLETESSKKNKEAINQLSKEEQRQVQQLKNRDNEVRSHEQAHLAAAGGLARGGASFSYATGPDGVRYAIGGEVGIDISPVSGDPAATLRKADTIRRAALAPASPSAQDYSVARSAMAMANKARADLIKLSMEETKVTEQKDTDQSQVDETNQEENTVTETGSTAEPGSLLDYSV